MNPMGVDEIKVMESKDQEVPVVNAELGKPGWSPAFM